MNDVDDESSGTRVHHLKKYLYTTDNSKLIKSFGCWFLILERLYRLAIFVLKRQNQIILNGHRAGNRVGMAIYFYKNMGNVKGKLQILEGAKIVDRMY